MIDFAIQLCRTDASVPAFVAAIKRSGDRIFTDHSGYEQTCAFASPGDPLLLRAIRETNNLLRSNING